MTVKLSVTQCTIPCAEGDRRGTLVLRLNDPTLSADGITHFIPINVETKTLAAGGKTIYVFTYDENLLADPGTILTAIDFTLVCTDVGDEYAIEIADKNAKALFQDIVQWGSPVGVQVDNPAAIAALAALDLTDYTLGALAMVDVSGVPTWFKYDGIVWTLAF